MTTKPVKTESLKTLDFLNHQTGNTAQMVIQDGIYCTQYMEVCVNCTIKAGVTDSDQWWASWSGDEPTSPFYFVTDKNSLDEALSSLQCELESDGSVWRWHHEITGF